MTSVSCGECGRELDEQEARLEASKRRPCPSCGSRRRHFGVTVTETASPSGRVARVHVIRPLSIESEEVFGAPTVKKTAPRRDVVEPLRLAVLWDEPSGPEGAYIARVYGPEGFRGIGIGETADDALSEILDRLFPDQ